MSKSYTAAFKAGSTAKIKAEAELLTQRTMRRAAALGHDPMNSHNMAAAICGRIMPKFKLVDGKRVWDLDPESYKV